MILSIRSRGNRALAMLRLRQFVPSEFCLKCFGCCRFTESKTIWAPSGLELKRTAFGNYICPHLKDKDNRCSIYSRRPLDCQIYPFLLVKRGGVLYLGADKDCSFIQEKKPDIGAFGGYLSKRLSRPVWVKAIKKNPGIIADYTGNIEIICVLERLFRELFIPRLNRFASRNKVLVDKYLDKGSSISAYSFASIFIWRRLFRIFWQIIEGSLCIFYQDKNGMFMALPPQPRPTLAIIRKCFEIMSFYNCGSQVGRIENVASEDLGYYRIAGLTPKLKDREYACLRQELVSLAGDKFKPKRAGYNYFVKNYKAKVYAYRSSMYNECVGLFRTWENLCKENPRSDIFIQMLEDSFTSFQVALENLRALGLFGLVVKVNNRIKACSFGYPLNKETFCILFEVCDLKLKGIAQFVFREFCRRLPEYKFINIMGSCELENLKKTKLSYRPSREIEVYNIYPLTSTP